MGGEQGLGKEEKGTQFTRFTSTKYKYWRNSSAKVRNLLALTSTKVQKYKSTNADRSGRRCTVVGQPHVTHILGAYSTLPWQRHGGFKEDSGTHFTCLCFTSTKVQILTQLLEQKYKY